MKRNLLLLFILGLLSIQASIAQTDDCTNPTNLNGGQLNCTVTSSSINGTTIGRNTDGFGAPCVDPNTIEGVWLQFTAVGPDIAITDLTGNNPHVIISENVCTPTSFVACQPLPLAIAIGQGDDILTIGTTYFIWVGFGGGTPNTFNLCIDNLAPPVNDDCDDRIALTTAELGCTGSNNLVTGTTIAANIDNLDFTGCINSNVESGVWYSFVAQGPDISISDNLGNNPFVVIRDDICADGVYFVCQQLPIDDADGQGDDQLVVGETYYVWVGFQGSQNDFELCINNPEPPDNDDCVDAIDISGSLSCISNNGPNVIGTTINSAPDGFDYSCLAAATNSFEGVWYSFTAIGYDLLINDIGNNAPYLVLLDACAGAEVYCGQVPYEYNTPAVIDNLLTIGTTYYAWIGFDNIAEDDFELCFEQQAPPANDICSGAINITGMLDCVLNGGTSLEGTTEFAFPDLFDYPGCINAGTDGVDGVWYSFTANGYDLIINDIAGNAPYVAIVDDCDNPNLIYCGQTPVDLSTSNNSDFELRPATTYYMWVGFDGGSDEEFEICIENPAPPDNDVCEDGTFIDGMINCPGGNTPIVGTTNFANILTNYVLPAPFDCIDGTVDEVVWYRFQAQGPDIEITDNLNNNPNIAIIEDNNCMNGAIVYACETLPMSGNNLLIAGQRYIIMLAFPGGWQATNDFELCVDNPIAPPNDLCMNAINITADLVCGLPGNGTVSGTTVNGSNYDQAWTSNGLPVSLNCIDTAIDDGVWYEFTSVGVDLAIDDNLGNNPYIIIIEDNGCVDTASVILCEQAPFFIENALSNDEDYLMLVAYPGGQDATDTFDLCIVNDGVCNGTPQPSSYCQTTPICGLAVLDAFCMEMANQNIPDVPWPGCTVTLHDPNWFTFVAGADQLTIEVEVTNCMNNQGVQIEMYEIPCTTTLDPNNPPCPPDDLSNPLGNCVWSNNLVAPGTTATFSGNTEFGHVYGIVLDGWAGDLCTIEINVLVGGNPPVLDTFTLDDPVWDPSVFPFVNDTICAGAEGVQFALQEEVPGSCRYDWTLDGVLVDGTNDIFEFFDFPDPGTFEVCVQASNYCSATMPICVEIIVSELVPVITRDTICEGDDFVWIGPFGDVLDIGEDVTLLEGGDFDYAENTVNSVGCEIDALLFLHVKDENDETPTMVDTVICAYSGPFTFHSPEIIDIPDNGVLEGEELDREIALGPYYSEHTCDSFFILNIYQLNADLVYEQECFDGFVSLNIDNASKYTPDPDIYTQVARTYLWTRLSDNTVMQGQTFEFLNIPLDSFTQLQETFELTLTMSFDGSDACTFQFPVMIDLLDYIPDSFNIVGPDTVCIGPDYEFELSQFNPTNLVDVDGYFWDVSGAPGASIVEEGRDTAIMTFSQIGNGVLCVYALAQCVDGPIFCRPIVISSPPIPDAGADNDECMSSYTLQATTPGGSWITINAPVGASSPVFDNVSSPNAEVTVIEKGVYTFGWLINAYGCSDTGRVSIEFIEPIVMVGVPTYMCDDISENYTAVFEFSGGLDPLTIPTGNATINGNIVTTDPIPQGQQIVVTIRDAEGCTGSFTLQHDCPCLSDPGVMNTNLIERCGESCLTVVPFTPPTTDPNDIFVYVLHTNATDVLGTKLAENQTGEFCFTNGGNLTYGVTYYVSILVGNELAGTVDETHGCTLSNVGQPVIWYETPAPSAGNDDATCGSTYGLNVSNSNFPGVWQIVSTETNVMFDDINSPTATLTALGCGIVNLQWVETNEICSDTSLVNIEFYCNPFVDGNLDIDCNVDQTALVVIFTLGGTEPFTETNGRGVVTGTNFMIEGLALNTPDTLYFRDGNNCELIVPIAARDCSCLPQLDPDMTICGLTLELESDGTGNGGFWENSDAGVVIASPNTRITQVTVPDYQTYCFTWTEVGDFCQSSDDICISFVKRPEIDYNSVVFECNDINEGYTVTFNIFDGDIATYNVFGVPGQVIGNQFVSEIIPSNTAVSIGVTDQYACDTVYLDTLHDCGCLTMIGLLNNAPLNLCLDGATSVVYDASAEVRDANDVLVYVLHTDPLDPLGSVILVSPTGIFSFTDAALVAGVTYYVTAIIGSESTGGNVNFADPCIDWSQAIPVVWEEAAVFTLSSSELEFTCLINQMTLAITTAVDLNDFDILWTASNGGIIEPGDEMSQTPRINGKGTYTLTLTHKVAGCMSMESITIDESSDVPIVRIASPLPLTCDRIQLTLTGAGSSQSPTITYEWTGPGILGANDALDVDINQAGTYTLTITDSANGCVKSESIIVTQDITQPNAAATVAEKLDCNTSEIAVSGLGSTEGGNFSYSWSSLDGNIVGTSSTRDITVNQTGTYQILVTNTNNGCTRTASVLVEEDESVISGAIIDIQQPGCDGESDGQINLQVQGGTPPFEYSFDGGTSFGAISTLSELAAGIYDLEIRDNNGCEWAGTAILVAPFDFTIDLGETILIDFGDTAYIEAITNLPDSLVGTINWTPIYEGTDPNSLTQQFVPELGQSQVSLTVSNSNGCVEQDNVLIVVRFAEKIYVPNGINPTSGNEMNKVFYVWAHPESVMSIDNVKIFDRWGEKVYEIPTIPPSLSLDNDYTWNGIWKGELAPPGVYVYVMDVEFVTGVKKVIKGDFTLIR